MRRELFCEINQKIQPILVGLASIQGDVFSLAAPCGDKKQKTAGLGRQPSVWIHHSDRKCASAERKGLLALLSSEALAAVNGTILAGLEGNLASLAAGSADSVKHLAGSAATGLAGIAAGFAALGLVFEALFCIELLLTGGEHEFVAAFFADQSFVLEDNGISSWIIFCPRKDSNRHLWLYDQRSC